MITEVIHNAKDNYIIMLRELAAECVIVFKLLFRLIHRYLIVT